jgi:hypothetical protein
VIQKKTPQIVPEQIKEDLPSFGGEQSSSSDEE